MMGLPIYHFTHPSDQKKMQSNLSKSESKVSTPSHSPSPSPPIASQSSTKEMALDVFSPSNASGREDRGPRQSFFIRIREKPLTKHDNSKYEHMHLVGHLKRTEDSSLGKYTFVGVMRPMRDRYSLDNVQNSETSIPVLQTNHRTKLDGIHPRPVHNKTSSRWPHHLYRPSDINNRWLPTV
jgi:hypothetical protein